MNRSATASATLDYSEKAIPQQTLQVLPVGQMLLFALLLCLISPLSFADRGYPIGEPRELIVDVAGLDSIELQLPPGDISLVHTLGSELRATMNVICHNRSGRCSDSLEDMEFVTRQNRNNLVVETNKSFRNFTGAHSIIVHIEVPEVAELVVRSPAGDVEIQDIVADSLHVDLKAGDLNLSNLAVCPSIEQGAGDIDVSLPYDLVSDIDIDVRIGDATLETPDNIVTAKRSWLIGAKIDWQSGSHSNDKGCSVEMKLGAGDVSLELT